MDSAAYTHSVTKDDNAEGKMVYGEHHIESRRAATKDAADLVARLSDGRLRLVAR